MTTDKESLDKIQVWLNELGVAWDAYDIPTENESIRVPAIGKDETNRSANLKNVEGKSLFYYDYVSRKSAWLNLDGSEHIGGFTEKKDLEEIHEKVARDTKQKLSRLEHRGGYTLYTQSKGINIRGDNVDVADYYVDGNKLVLPLTDIYGNIVNAQTISQNRINKSKFDKRFEKDGRTKGVVYYHATPSEARIFIVCEGWATGYSIQKFLNTYSQFEGKNIVAVSAMSVGNMPLVADLLEETFQDSTVIFACDNDEAGRKVLEGRRNPYIMPPEEGQDFDDIRMAKDGNLTGKAFIRPLKKILDDLKPIATLRYVNHNVGSGKTYRFVNIVKNSEDSFIYVAPSHELIEQTAKDIRSAGDGLDVEEITYKTTNNNASVRNAAKDALEACINAPARRIICLSHVTFLRIVPLMDPKLKAKFRVYIDETLKSLDIFNISFGTGTRNIERSFEDFSSLFTINTLGRLISTTDEMTDTRIYGDSVKKLKRELREELVTPGRVCSVTMVGRIKQYIQNGGKWAPEVDNENQFISDSQSEELKATVAVHTDPKIFKGFKTFTIMSAMFEQSPLAHLWRSLRVNVIPDADFEDITSTEHLVGKRLRIYYCAERAALGRLRAFDPEDNKFEIEVILKGIQEFFGNKKYLYQINNEFKSNGANELKLEQLLGANATSIPMKPEGLNHYANYSNIACLGVINPAPEVVNHMKYLTGLDVDVLRNDTRKHSINQALGRTSIRDRNATEEVTVVVVGKVDAEWLNKYYVGSTLMGLLPTLEGKVRIRLTQEQKDGAEITKYLDGLYNNGLVTSSVGSSQVMEELGLDRLRHQRAVKFIGKGWVKQGQKYWKSEHAPQK